MAEKPSLSLQQSSQNEINETPVDQSLQLANEFFNAL
jgi:hypothetical protein